MIRCHCDGQNGKSLFTHFKNSKVVQLQEISDYHFLKVNITYLNNYYKTKAGLPGGSLGETETFTKGAENLKADTGGLPLGEEESLSRSILRRGLHSTPE